MGAVVPFRRRRERRSDGRRHVTGFAVVVESRPREVTLIADDIALELTPEQARELARELTEGAADSEAR